MSFLIKGCPHLKCIRSASSPGCHSTQLNAYWSHLKLQTTLATATIYLYELTTEGDGDAEQKEMVMLNRKRIDLRERQ